MKYTAFIILFFLFSGTPAQAALKSSAALSTQVEPQIFHAELKEGFHFNSEAPNHITIDGTEIQPDVILPREVKFSNLPKDWKAGKAQLYICDDSLTFCEMNSFDFNHDGTLAAKNTVAETKTVKKGKTNHHGFIENDLAQAVEIAKRQKRLVLIDFSARWCPGCIRLETETFGTPEFKKWTKNFVKVTLDVDRFENTAPSEKFSVHAIPTLLVINSDMEEIDRLVDYQPQDRMQAFFAAIARDPRPPRELLRELGQRLVAAGHFKDSIQFLSLIKPAPPELLQAKVESTSEEFKKDKDKKGDYEQALRQAIETEPHSSRSLDWRAQLLRLISEGKSDAAKDEVRKITREGVELADSLLADPEKLKDAVKTDLVGEFTGYEPLFIAMYRAELIDASGEEGDASLLAWQKAADVGKGLKIMAAQHGPAVRFLVVLTQAKRFEEAKKLADDLLKKNPGDGDLQRRKLKVLVELKEFPEAIALGQTCLKNSYARNEFWVVETLAKAYIGAEKKDEARNLLDSYLKRDEISWPSIAYSEKNLEELRKKL